MIDGCRVAVVIPAYRVDAEIGDVLTAMPTAVDSVIVVDDCSDDGTADVVSVCRDARVHLVRHAQNEGVGGAMATGFQHALQGGADIVVKCDGDGQMDPRDIPLLTKPLIEGRAEYAKACRFHHVTELQMMPRVRLLGNVMLTFLTKLASGYWQILDPQNGFVAIRADVLGRLPIARLAKDYFFENDMLIRLNCLEARVIDVPLPARYGDERSSLRPGRIVLSFPLRLLLGFCRRVMSRYVFYDVSPVAVFLFFGSLLLLFGTVFGGYHWIMNAMLHRATPTGTVIIATLPIILGFQLLLQALVLDVQNSPRPGVSSRPPPVGE